MNKDLKDEAALQDNGDSQLLENTSTNDVLPQPSRLTLLMGSLRNYRTLAHFSSASVGLNVATLIANFLILRWLEPETLGLWQSLLLIQTYSLIIQGGVFNGLNRELPYSMGNGDERAVMELAGTAQAVSIFGAILLSICAAGVLFFPLNISIRLGAAVVFICSAGAIYRNYLTVTYRADRAFATLAHIRMVETVMVLFTLPLIYYFEYAGLAGRFVIITFLGVILNHIYRPLHVKTQFSTSHLIRLLKVGLPIYICGYLLTVSSTFPRLILLSEDGLKQVGLFAPVYAVMGMMQMLPESIAQYIYPHMSYRYGKTGDPESLWPMAWKTATGVVVLSLPGLVVCMFAVPWIIEWFFPKYVESAVAIKWGLISGVFLGGAISVNALLSLKAWLWLTVYTAFQVISTFLLSFSLYRIAGNPLEGVAAGYAIAQGLSFPVGMYCIYRATHVRMLTPETVAID